MMTVAAGRRRAREGSAQPLFAAGMPTRSSSSTARVRGRARAQLQVLAEALGDLVAHGQDGVHRRRRILEDHGHVPAAHEAQLGRASWSRSRPSKTVPPSTRPRPGKEPQDAKAAHGLPGPALAHERQRLALVEPVRDPVHGVHHPWSVWKGA